MGSSLGYLLTLFLLVQGMAFAGDLWALQVATNSLNGAASTAVRYIASVGKVDRILRRRLLDEAKCTINLPDKTYKVGDLLSFTLTREHQPIYLSKDPMTLTVKRSVIVGYR